MSEEVSSRRLVLQGALAAGCSLIVPVALFSPLALGADPAPPAATKKVSQASVQYQGTPKSGQKCSDCIHFIAKSNTCKLVEGNISANGWCSLWAKA